MTTSQAPGAHLWLAALCRAIFHPPHFRSGSWMDRTDRAHSATRYPTLPCVIFPDTLQGGGSVPPCLTDGACGTQELAWGCPVSASCSAPAYLASLASAPLPPSPSLLS